MADLGSIGLQWVGLMSPRIGDSNWTTLTINGFTSWMQNPDPNVGTISGVVKVAGVISPNAKVYLINKATQHVEFHTRTDSLGAFRFDSVPMGQQFTCITYADGGTHNAAVVDGIIAS